MALSVQTTSMKINMHTSSLNQGYSSWPTKKWDIDSTATATQRKSLSGMWVARQFDRTYIRAYGLFGQTERHSATRHNLSVI